MSELIPRLEMSGLDARLAAALEPRVKRLGYLGEFFKCAGHQPAALLAFMQLHEALAQVLPQRLTEIVALAVTAATGNDYERHQHEHLAEKLGYGRGWIAAAISPHRDGLDASERAVQRLALAALADHGHGVAEELAGVVAAIGAAQAMAVLLLIGRYQLHSTIVNALELRSPVASIFAQAGV
jgi:hypothetical protein